MPEWDYKVLVVNQKGRVEYIDGMHQGVYRGSDMEGGYSHYDFPLRLAKILPKLKANGWEVDDIEKTGSFWSRKLTYYTLKRLLEEDELSDE